MKKRTLPLFFLGWTVLSLMLLNSCTSKTASTAKQNKEYALETMSPNSLCLVQPSWFPHSQTPAPEEGIGSPFDVSSTTNQIFHQWSWNKFLWLTKPDKGGNPLFLNLDKVKQVTTYMDLVTVPSGTLVVLQDFQQAGSNQPRLQTNPDYNGGKSELVYYSIHMNPTMYEAGKKYGAMLSAGQLAYNNEATFPVGSFELKVAWVAVSAIPTAKLSSYYTTMASLSADGGKTYTNTKVALIGMHVVGVVQNHPEFIWATFEHDDLAPNYDWKMNLASTTQDKLLYKKGTVSGIDGIRFDTKTNLGMTPYQVFDLFQYGVPRNNKSNKGEFMLTSQEEPVNFNNVDGINQCVHAKLDDVWKNYFYNGSIWLNMDGKTPAQQAYIIDSLGGGIGNVTPGSFARGSMNCANVTMESFTQTFTDSIGKINVNTLANCFSCHKASSFFPKAPPRFNSPLYLSHVFQDYVDKRRGTPVQEVEKLKTEDEKRTMLRLSK